jgi:hypothetical protein
MKAWKRKARCAGGPADGSVMQVSKNWGCDRSATSGTSSDEEHYVESAVTEARKHLSALSKDPFKAFGNIRRLQKPLERPDDISAVDHSTSPGSMRERVSLYSTTPLTDEIVGE